ncbi:hypothetical protein L798_12319 [Zootermopsis nevadensis]|uniref:Uncharacterized protein n=1 Tax=Zootermopsis nevadensis TaxID=136037 RepID=A0A067QUQ0_ZOONE|nr:hypothetical protein L798_12319 [Zootermopsis nevadensis]
MQLEFLQKSIKSILSRFDIDTTCRSLNRFFVTIQLSPIENRYEFFVVIPSVSFLPFLYPFRASEQVRGAQLSDRPHTKKKAARQSMLTSAVSSFRDIQDAAAQ